MNELNPQLKSQVRALGKLCCRQLNQETLNVDAEAALIIAALAKGGYDRISDINLQSDVEAAALDCCKELTMNRRDELLAITSGFQRTFRGMIDWEIVQPDDHQPRE